MGEVANDLLGRGRDLPAGLTPDDVQRRLVNAVIEGGELGDVVALVSAFFGAPALATTGDGRVLATAGDRAALERVRGCSLFHDSGRFLTEVALPGVHTAADLSGSQAVVAISGGRIDHGRLALFHPDRLLAHDDLAVLDRAADVAAICLTQHFAVTAVESKYRGDFLRDVLAGRAAEDDDVTGHARSLGWELERPQVVVVAALETENAPPMSRGYHGPLQLERFAAAWATVVAARDPGAPVVGFATEVVALLPVVPGEERRAVAETIHEVRGDGGGGRRTFAAGVSRVVHGPDGLAAGYEQARKAVVAGRRMHGPGAVAHFDDLGVFRLLSLIDDEQELDRFVRETLRGLAPPVRGQARGRSGGRPGRGTTDDSPALRRTLQVLLDSNLNVAEAARLLHLHYNTLRYRIGKIERLVGPFTTDPNLRLDLALALRVVAMREA